MAAVAALWGFMTSLPLTSNSFLGQQFSPPVSPSPIKFVEKPCTIVIRIEAPIHSLNVMLYSKEKQVASRVGHKILEDGTKVHYLIKTGEIIDSAENWK